MKFGQKFEAEKNRLRRLDKPTRDAELRGMSKETSAPNLFSIVGLLAYDWSLRIIDDRMTLNSHAVRIVEVEGLYVGEAQHQRAIYSLAKRAVHATDAERLEMHDAYAAARRESRHE